MKCSECEKRLPMYAGKKLDADLRGEMDAHLKQCSLCNGLEQSIAGVADVLGRMSPAAVPAGLAERAANHALCQVPETPRRMFAERFLSVGWAASAVVGVALVFLVVLAPHPSDSHIDSVTLAAEMEDLFLLSEDAWNSDILLASGIIE